MVANLRLWLHDGPVGERVPERLRLSGDARLLITGQGVRAAGYGFTAVILGALLADRGYGPLQVGVVLTALIAGTALASLVVGAVADRVGRRRCCGGFFLLIAAAGAAVAAGAPYWLLLVIALTGALSTDVVDNGPATTLEQVMLAAEDAGSSRVYGRYNAVGAAAGALGALAASLPALRHGPGVAVQAWWFAVLVPVGLAGTVLAWRLTGAVEADPPAVADKPTVLDALRGRSGIGPSRRWCAGCPGCSQSTPPAADWSPPRSCPTSSPPATGSAWRRWVGCSSRCRWCRPSRSRPRRCWRAGSDWSRPW